MDNGIPSWDEYYLEMLETVRSRSPDSQTKVGCIITENNHLISIGYNGWPAGIDNLPSERPNKYSWMVHSELNAIVNAQIKPKRPTAYITHIPCNVCSKALWNWGCRRIVINAVKAFTQPDDDYKVLLKLVYNGLQLDLYKNSIKNKIRTDLFFLDITEEQNLNKLKGILNGEVL